MFDHTHFVMRTSSGGGQPLISGGLVPVIEGIILLYSINRLHYISGLLL